MMWMLRSDVRAPWRRVCGTRKELEHLHIGPLALRTLNRRLHQLADLTPDWNPADVPPILQIDAIWITLLRPNGQVRRDRKGRKRAVKGRFKCPVLIAMGVWPDTDRCEILLWRLGSSEDAEEWVAFRSLLEEQGIRGEKGLKLIIHDGGSGLCSALRTVYFDAGSSAVSFTSCATSAKPSMYLANSPPNNDGDDAKPSSKTFMPSGNLAAMTLSCAAI
jgi:hypothetical protein